MLNSELLMVHAIIAFSSILIGVLGKFLRPEKPNSMMGYRTPMSMKSQATWEFANQYAGNLMAWSAIVAITIQAFAYFVLEPTPSIFVAVAGSTVSLIGVMGVTEYQLKKRFDKEGNPKSTSQIEDRF